MKAVGMFAQGIAANDAGKYTRKVMAINATNSRNEGVAERERIRLAARMQMGRQITDQGASGFQIGTGSPLDALRVSATARELDILTSRANAEGRAQGFKQQGDLAYAEGYSKMVGGIISGAAELMDEVAGAFGGGGGAAKAGGH